MMIMRKLLPLPWPSVLMVLMVVVMGSSPLLVFAATPAPTTPSAAAPPKASVSTTPPPTTTTSAPPTNVISSPPPKTAAAVPPSVSLTPPPVVVATPPPISAVPPPKAAPVPSSKTPPPQASIPPISPPLAAPPKASTPASSPAPLSSSPAPSPISAPTLDPSQIAALISLKVNYSTPDPCATSKDILICDNTTSPRHLLALSLNNCPASAKLSTQALFNLSSLKALSFLDCPMVPVHVPSVLVKSLTSFSCTASLGKTGTDETASKLSGVWLSKLSNLNDITVTDVECSASGLNVITEGLKSVTQLTIARTNIPGTLPKHTWPPGVQYIDVSGNAIRGSIPTQMGGLTQLTHLDLSDNQLKGSIPNFFGQLSNLQLINLAGNELSGPIPGSLSELHNCSHLDLSNNKLNGSILANITNMKALRYLDISNNDLTGAVPFNNTFLNRLTIFKLSGNTGLCYNHTSLKSKFLTGIPNCPSVANIIFAPSPAPALSSVATGSGGHPLSKGGIAGISVMAIVVGAGLFLIIRKWWRAREEPDQFLNLRAQRS